MSAPPFHSALPLREDLRTLGHPRPDDPNLLISHGQHRLDLLQWLVHRIHPDLHISDEAEMAHFWHSLGVQSHPPNANGFRIPMTAPAQKARDRAAASAYLRACIDLVFAFNSLEQQQQQQQQEQEQAQQTHAESAIDPFTQYDFDMFKQTQSLIANRHLLFPDTINLLHAPAKRKPLKPLTRRPPPSTNRPATQPPSHKSASSRAASKPSAPLSREKILAQLRTLNRETTEIHEALRASNPQYEPSHPIDTEENEEDTLPDPVSDMQAISQLADDAKQLCSLFEQFIHITSDTYEKRQLDDDIAVYNAQQDEQLSELMPACNDLMHQTSTFLSDLALMNESMQDLEDAKTLIEVLPNSASVRAVEEQAQRTQAHM